jgi:hypothetical protein
MYKHRNNFIFIGFGAAMHTRIQSLQDKDVKVATLDLITYIAILIYITFVFHREAMYILIHI